MYRNATDPTLWEHSFQQITPYLVNEEPELYMKLLNLNRFKRIKKIFLELTYSLSTKHINSLFGSLGQKKYLKEVYFGGGECNLSSVPSNVLTNFLKEIPSVTFDFGTRITEEQVRSLFKSIENGNNVKKLYLEEMNLESIEAKTFARAVNHLQEFSSHYIEITDEQVKDMFYEMTKQTNLEKFVFHHTHVKHIDADTLAQAFNNLTDLTINLSDLPFSNNQILKIFKQMAQKTKLEKLEILTYSYPDMWDFSFIPPNILADAVKSLREIYMTDIVFSNSQICRMLEILAKNDEKIVLDLGCCNLSDVPLELLKEVFEKLEPNNFARKLQYRIVQLNSESAVNQFRNEIDEVFSEHRKLVEELRRIKKVKRLTRLAVGVSKFHQKSKYSSRNRYLGYFRRLKNANFCRRLKSHARL